MKYCMFRILNVVAFFIYSLTCNFAEHLFGVETSMVIAELNDSSIRVFQVNVLTVILE